MNNNPDSVPKKKKDNKKEYSPDEFFGNNEDSTKTMSPDEFFGSEEEVSEPSRDKLVSDDFESRMESPSYDYDKAATRDSSGVTGSWEEEGEGEKEDDSEINRWEQSNQEVERNPLKSLAKTFGSTFSNQMKAGGYGTHATLAPSHSAVSDPRGDRFMRFRQKSDEALKNIKKEEKKQSRESALKAFETAMQEMDEYREDMKGVTNRISEIDDTIDAVNYLGSAIGQAGAQMPASVLSMGASSFGQEIGHNYIEQVEEIAKKEGISPEEVIKQGKDNKAAATAYGTLAGGLDYLGARKATEAIPFSSFKRDLGRRAMNMFEGMRTELYTEGGQSIISQFGSKQGAGESVSESVRGIDPQAVAEEGLAGFFGSSGVNVGSQIASDVRGRRGNRGQVSDETARMMDEEIFGQGNQQQSQTQDQSQQDNQRRTETPESGVRFEYDPEASVEEQRNQLDQEKKRLLDEMQEVDKAPFKHKRAKKKMEPYRKAVRQINEIKSKLPDSEGETQVTNRQKDRSNAKKLLSQLRRSDDKNEQARLIGKLKALRERNDLALTVDEQSEITDLEMDLGFQDGIEPKMPEPKRKSISKEEEKEIERAHGVEVNQNIDNYQSPPEIKAKEGSNVQDVGAAEVDYRSRLRRDEGERLEFTEEELQQQQQEEQERQRQEQAEQQAQEEEQPSEPDATGNQQQQGQQRQDEPTNALGVTIEDEQDANELQSVRDEIQEEMNVLEDNEATYAEKQKYQETLDFLDNKIEQAQQQEEENQNIEESYQRQRERVQEEEERAKSAERNLERSRKVQREINELDKKYGSNYNQDDPHRRKARVVTDHFDELSEDTQQYLAEEAEAQEAEDASVGYYRGLREDTDEIEWYDRVGRVTGSHVATLETDVIPNLEQEVIERDEVAKEARRELEDLEQIRPKQKKQGRQAEQQQQGAQNQEQQQKSEQRNREELDRKADEDPDWSENNFEEWEDYRIDLEERVFQEPMDPNKSVEENRRNIRKQLDKEYSKIREIIGDDEIADRYIEAIEDQNADEADKIRSGMSDRQKGLLANRLNEEDFEDNAWFVEEFEEFAGENKQQKEDSELFDTLGDIITTADPRGRRSLNRNENQVLAKDLIVELANRGYTQESIVRNVIGEKQKQGDAKEHLEQLIAHNLEQFGQANQQQGNQQQNQEGQPQLEEGQQGQQAQSQEQQPAKTPEERELEGQLADAQAEFEAARNALESKARATDQEIQRDSEDLWGNRPKEQDAQQNAFDQRVDPSQRSKATEQERARYEKAKQEVNRLQKELEQKRRQRRPDLFNQEQQQGQVQQEGQVEQQGQQDQQNEAEAFVTADERHRVERDEEGNLQVKKADGTPLSRRSKNFNKVLAEYIDSQGRQQEGQVSRGDYRTEQEYFDAVAEESTDPEQIAEAYEEARQSEGQRRAEEETGIQSFIRDRVLGGKRMKGVIGRQDMEHYLGKSTVRSLVREEPRLNFIFSKNPSHKLDVLTQSYNDQYNEDIAPEDMAQGIFEEVKEIGNQNRRPDALAEAFEDITGQKLTNNLARDIRNRAEDRRQEDQEAEGQQQAEPRSEEEMDPFEFFGQKAEEADQAPFQQQARQKEDSQTTVQRVLDRVQQAFPNLSIHNDQQSFDTAYQNSNKYDPDIEEPAALLKDGEVYINPRKAGPDTPVHEVGEVWMNAAEDYYPEFVENGKRLVEGTEYDTWAQEQYPNESRDTQLREALVQAVADHGANTIRYEANHPIRAWIKDMLRKIKNMLGIRPNIDFDTMTLGDISTFVSEELVSGIPVTTVDGQQVNLIARGKRGRGVQIDNGLLIDREYKPERYRRFLKKWFRSHEGVPQSVDELWGVWKGRVENHYKRAEANVNELKRKIRELYGPEPTREQLDPINEALGDVDKIENLPEQLQEPVYYMRAHIDALSTDFIESGLADDELVGTITDNIGLYVHRSFRAHSDPNWTLDELEKNSETKRMLNHARAQLRQEMKGHARDVRERANNLLERNQNEEINELRTRIAKLEARGETTRVQLLKDKLKRLQEREFDKEAQELFETAERFEDPTTAQINRVLENYVEGFKSNARSAVKAGENIAQKDLDVLKKRKNLPQWLLDVLGEYKHPADRYIRSVTKMVAAVENHKFLTEAAITGRGKYFFKEGEDNYSRRFNAKISQENNPMLYPLDGMVTTPEIKEALENDIDPSYHNAFLRSLLAINGAAKYSKTILSPMTHIRNFTGNFSMVGATGHLNFGPYFMNSVRTVRAALKARRSTQLKKVDLMKNGKFIQRKPNELTDQQWKDLQKYFEYARLNIIDENPISGEMMDLVEDVTKQEPKDLDNLMEVYANRASKPFAQAKRIGSQAYNTAAKVYQSGDDFFKIMLYEMELDRYAKAYKNDRSRIREDGSYTEKFKREIAHKVRRTLPTYSRTPRISNFIRKFPVMGSFVSFNVALTQATLHNAKFAKQELQSRNPELRKIGAKRLVGMLSINSLAYGLEAASIAGAYSLTSMGVSYLMGNDEEEGNEERPEEGTISREQLNALKMFGAPWMQNSNIIYLGKDGKGNHSYIDVSYTIPHSLYGRAANAVLRRQGDDVMEESMARGAIEGVAEWLSPALSEEIGFRALRESIFEDARDLNEIYKSDQWHERFSGRMLHFLKGIEPGVITRGRSITKGLAGIKDENGETIDATKPMIKMLSGINVSKIDPKKSFMFKMRDLSDKLRSAKYKYYRYVNNDDVDYDKETLDEQYREANEDIQRHIESYRRYVNAARKLGLNNKDMRKQMETANLENMARKVLLYESNPTYPFKKKHSSRSLKE